MTETERRGREVSLNGIKNARRAEGTHRTMKTSEEAVQMAATMRRELRKVFGEVRMNGPYVAQMIRLVHEFAEQAGESAKGSVEETNALRDMSAALDAIEAADNALRRMGHRLSAARQTAEEAEQRRAEQRRKLKI